MADTAKLAVLFPLRVSLAGNSKTFFEGKGERDDGNQ